MFYRDKTKFCSEPFCKDLQTDLDNYFSHRPTLSNENLSNYLIILSTLYYILLNPCAFEANFKKNWKTLTKTLDQATKGLLTSIKKKRRMFKSHFVSGEEKKNHFIKFTLIN